MSSDDVSVRDGEVGIGAAAALFGLSPSTLRWWEGQAVVPPPPRRGATRRYGHRELRRIGLAYLCCVAGAMPLARAAVVVSGAAGHERWQAEVLDQVDRLTRDIGRLEVARDQLRHLLACTDDDPAVECPYLDGVLAEHTPRGRVDEPDLLAAAVLAVARPADERDDRRPDRHAGVPSAPGRLRTPHRRPAPDGARCAQCDAALPRPVRGRARTYCSAACRQRAYRRRTSPERPGVGADAVSTMPNGAPGPRR